MARLMNRQVLIVDDDAELAEMLGIVLRAEGFEPLFATDGETALMAFIENKPDAILLDLGLPGVDGVVVCRQIRAESARVPILMVTARSDAGDVVRGLEAGADDYILKPFPVRVLIARIRAHLRRSYSEAEQPEILSVGDVSIDVAGHSVKRDGKTINLTRLEFDLLVALARRPRQAFSRQMLLEQVWGYQYPAEKRLVNTRVQQLRAKLERNPERPEIVLTVRGVGYKAGPR
jgi:two-component system, OmpR family, response regulator MtrA